MQPPLNRERQECASSSTQTPGIGPLLKRFVQDDEAKGRGGLAVMFGLLIVVAFVLLPTLPSNAQKKSGLPGARPVINAAEFSSIQAALDAVPKVGGIVKLPAGEFEISKPLVLTTEDTWLQGAGAATHIKNVNEEGQPALIVQHPKGAKAPRAEWLWRVKLSDFRITGNKKSGHGIHANRINEIFIQGVTVSYNGGDGILLNYCYEDPRVSDCLITYNAKTGLDLLGCHDIVVSASQFEENMDALHCFDGFNLCMTGNCLDDHLGDGVVIENTYGSVVSGNMIEECKGRAIVLDRNCYGNTLSANVIAHDGGGVDLVDAHGCAVSANTFTLMSTDAVRVGPNSGRITITGNNFCNSFIGAGSVKRRVDDLAAAGLTLESTKDVAVSGNIFASVKPKALELRGDASKNILFSNNVLVDVESDHAKLKDSTVSDVLSVEGEAASGPPARK
ncbi:MAG: hypothetical protein CMJ78_24245 [Planctomycetaceae bacterium]|nr:hypothetical protein [Planctomycetaceae bacterium]